MLNVLRDTFKQGFLLKGILILVALSLTAYLGAYFFERQGPAGGPQAWAARVNGREISVRDFQNAARNQAAYYRQLLGEDYDRSAVAQQAIRGLITREIMHQEALRVGLEVSPLEIRDRIYRDLRFQGPDGRFIGADRYRDVVRRQYRVDVQTFESSLEAEILGGKWTELVTDPLTVSAAELEEVYRYRNEKTAIDYALLRSDQQELDTAVSDAELDAWYEGHRDDYLRPETRNLRMVVVDREAVMETVEISDADVAAWYEANRAVYARPEQRRARQILFRLEPGADDAQREAYRRQAETALARVRAGEDFAELARAMSQDPETSQTGGDLGWVNRGQLAPRLDEAVFATAKGSLAPVVESALGFHVVEVTDLRPAGVAPLEEVREAIRRSQALRRAQDLVLETASRIAEQAGSAEGLAAAAEAEGLEVVARSVAEGDRMIDLGPSPELLTAVFEANPGEVRGPLGLARGMSVIAVESVVAPDVLPLAEVRERVRSDVLNRRLKDAALDRARRALKRAGSVAKASAALGLTVQSSGDLVPGDSPPIAGGGSPALFRELFGGEIQTGQTGVVEVPAGALLYEVTFREPFDADAFEEARASLEREVLDERRNDLLNTLLIDLSDSYQVEVNDELIRSIAGTGPA